MSQIPSPQALVNERPIDGAAVLLARAYWHRDAATGDWTVTTDPTQESGRLAYVPADDAYELTLLGALGGAAVLSLVARAGTDFLIY